MQPDWKLQQAGFVPTRPRADHPVEIDTIPVLARPILASRTPPGNVVHHGDCGTIPRNRPRGTTYTGGPDHVVRSSRAAPGAHGRRCRCPWWNGRRGSTGRSARPGLAAETGGGATGVRSPLLVTGSA